MIAAIGSPGRTGLVVALVIALGGLIFVMWPRLELGRDPDESAFVLAAAVICSVLILALGFAAEIVRRGLSDPVVRVVERSQGFGSLALVTPCVIAVAALAWAAEQRKREDPPPSVVGIVVAAAMLLGLVIGVLAAAFRMLGPVL